jgi:tetratricopeptide (TPR) repeat protein
MTPPADLRGMVLCQACGASNADDREYCARCHQKLLVLSGPFSQEGEEEFEDDADESFSFDEHLLERISVLEETVRRAADSLRQIYGALHKQERTILVNQTGLVALRELLAEKGTVAEEEWTERWESRMAFQLLALEKRERFLAIKDRVAALYRGDRRRDFAAHLDDADHALASFDVERAMTALEAAHRLDRNNYELAYFLGETRFSEGDAAAALGYFARVLEARPDHYEGLVYSGVLEHERGAGERAEALLKRAVALYPEAFLPNFSLGAIYSARGDLARAVVYLERAVAAEAVPQALYLLGRAYHEMGRLAPAIRRLREAVRLDPTLEEAHHLLGLAYLDRRWNRKALAAFREARRLNPKRLRYQDLVRYLSSQTGSPLPTVEGQAGEHLGRAEEALAAGRARQALEEYRRALGHAPDHPTLLISCALLALQLGRAGEVESMARKVLSLEPGEMLRATAGAALIESLRGQGRLREGNLLGRRLLEDSATPFGQTLACYEMACNLAEMDEDLDHALDYAKRALELAPEEIKAFPLAALGWVHYKRREYGRAVGFLDRAAELAPSASTYTHLGMALLAAGDEERARSTLERARGLEEEDRGLGRTMLQCMKDSTRLHDRVRSRGGRRS